MKFVVKNHLGYYITEPLDSGAPRTRESAVNAKQFDTYGAAADWAQENDVLGWEVEELKRSPTIVHKGRS